MDRSSPDIFCSLDEVIVPPAPSRRGSALERQAADSEAMVELSRALADVPEQALQRLVELAMQATDAGSAGLSLEERDDEGLFLRWVATAGALGPYVNGTMPRDFSPCGTAMDWERPLVMRDPARYYAYCSQLGVPLRSALLVPFQRAGKPCGTVWAIAHEADKAFTVDDQQAVQELATFASEVLDAFDAPTP